MSCVRFSHYQFSSLFIKGACSHPDADYTLSDIDPIGPVKLIDDGTGNLEASEGQPHHTAAGFDRKEDTLIRLIHLTRVKCLSFTMTIICFNQFNHFSGLQGNVKGARCGQALGR